MGIAFEHAENIRAYAKEMLMVFVDRRNRHNDRG
jgi:hypothetical protein